MSDKADVPSADKKEARQAILEEMSYGQVITIDELPAPCGQEARWQAVHQLVDEGELLLTPLNQIKRVHPHG